MKKNEWPFLCALLLLLLSNVHRLDAGVVKDAQGRVQSSVTVNADGSRHVQSTQYWDQSTVARRTVDEDFDSGGRATKRAVQEFDNQGRPQERLAVSIDATGKERGTRTRYTYDAEGHRTEATLPVGQ